MGLWGKIGKGLLKIAPYAAMAIPGIGPVASMGIQAGLGAANSAASGGGWKGALGGAATGALTSKLGGAGKGLGPSAGVAAKAGLKGTLGNVAKAAGTGILGGALQGINGPVNQTRAQGPNITGSARGIGPDMSNPNLADALESGRREAIRNQPFRGGYDITTQGPDDAMGNTPPPTTNRMPPIFSGGNNRRRQQMAY